MMPLEHAMSAEQSIPVSRRYAFDWDSEIFTIWYPNLIGTQVLNAYTLIFPNFERLMLRWVGESARGVEDPLLREQLRAFSSQEAAHAHQHERATQLLRDQGYRIDGLLHGLEWLTRRVLEPGVALLGARWGREFKLGVCAAAEHWTAVFANANLACAPEAFPKGPMAKLYFWHGLEELEHKSVVFDLLCYRTKSYALRIGTFLFWTGCFIAISLASTLWLTLQLEARHLLSHWMLRDTGRYLFTQEALFGHGVRGFLGYLRPDFHPRQHDTRRASEIAARSLQDDRPYTRRSLLEAAFSEESARNWIRDTFALGPPTLRKMLADPFEGEKALRALSDRAIALGTRHLDAPLRHSPVSARSVDQ